MNGPQVTHNLPHLLLFIVIFSFFVFVVIAYFTGTGLKGGKKKLHQTIFYRFGQSIKERFFTPLFLKIRRLLFQAVGPIYDSIKQVREALKENIASEDYITSLPPEERERMVSISSKHIDGTMNAPQRDELLGWLKEDGEDNECRILTNVRCLSEGVDVPSLDSVLFLSARNSQVDVVQCKGQAHAQPENARRDFGGKTWGRQRLAHWVVQCRSLRIQIGRGQGVGQSGHAACGLG